MSTPVTRFQIISSAPEQAGAFYGALFNWKVTTDNALGYREIDTGSKQGIQGGIWPAPPTAGSFVQLFVSVDDVRAKAADAQTLGAKLIVAPAILPDGDEMAVLQDPQGMTFGIWRPAGAA